MPLFRFACFCSRLFRIALHPRENKNTGGSLLLPWNGRKGNLDKPASQQYQLAHLCQEERRPSCLTIIFRWICVALKTPMVMKIAPSLGLPKSSSRLPVALHERPQKNVLWSSPKTTTSRAHQTIRTGLSCHPRGRIPKQVALLVSLHRPTSKKGTSRPRKADSPKTTLKSKLLLPKWSKPKKFKVQEPRDAGLQRKYMSSLFFFSSFCGGGGGRAGWEPLFATFLEGNIKKTHLYAMTISSGTTKIRTAGLWRNAGQDGYKQRTHSLTCCSL